MSAVRSTANPGAAFKRDMPKPAIAPFGPDDVLELADVIRNVSAPLSPRYLAHEF